MHLVFAFFVSQVLSAGKTAQATSPKGLLTVENTKKYQESPNSRRLQEARQRVRRSPGSRHLKSYVPNCEKEVAFNEDTFSDYGRSCSCQKLSNGIFDVVCQDSCLTCITGTPTCYDNKIRETVVQLDNDDVQILVEQCFGFNSSFQFCMTYNYFTEVLVPNTCQVNGQTCNSCSGDCYIGEADCSNASPGASFTYSYYENQASGFDGIYSQLEDFFLTKEVYEPLCGGNSGSSIAALWIGASLVATIIAIS